MNPQEEIGNGLHFPHACPSNMSLHLACLYTQHISTVPLPFSYTIQRAFLTFRTCKMPPKEHKSSLFCRAGATMKRQGSNHVKCESSVCICSFVMHKLPAISIILLSSSIIYILLECICYTYNTLESSLKHLTIKQYLTTGHGIL